MVECVVVYPGAVIVITHVIIVEVNASFNIVIEDLQSLDIEEFDGKIPVAPLKPAQDALVLDNSELTIEQAVEQVLDWWQQRQPFMPGVQG